MSMEETRQAFTDGWNRAFTEETRAMMPEGKEILEAEEFTDCLMKVIVSTALDGSGAGIFDAAHSTKVTDGILHFQESGMKDPAAFRKRLLEINTLQDDRMFIQSNCSISSSFLYPGFLAHWHRNTYFDVVYVFEGGCPFYFRKEKLLLQPGDVLIVPPGIEHGESVEGMENIVMTTAIRRDNFLEIFFRLFESNRMLHSFFTRILSGDQHMPYLMFRTARDGSSDEKLNTLFQSVYDEQRKSIPYHSEMCDLLMGETFVHILRKYERTIVLPESCSIVWKEDYAGILSYISDHYTTVTIGELAERFHYSRRQVVRIVQNCTGENFTDVLQKLKIRRARMYLENTTLPVEQVAENCGYENTSGFIRAFRKQTGMTPAEFRRKAGA